MAKKVATRQTLIDYIDTFKADARDLVNVQWDDVRRQLLFTALSNSTLTVPLPKEKANGHNVGDMKYMIKTDTDWDHGWYECRGQTLRQDQFPELYAVLGNTYSTAQQIADGLFALPDMGIDESTPRLLANSDGTNFNYRNNSSGTITLSRSNLPNELVYSVTADNPGGYTDRFGEHSHAAKFKGTYKSGKDTLTAYSFSEDRAGERWVYSNNEVDDYKGRHTHYLFLNGNVTQTTFNMVQPTARLGRWFIYSGRWRIP